MKKDVILFIGIFLVLLLLAGGTYAYWGWQSDTDKSVVFNTVSDIDDYVVYDAGDSHFVGDFQPYDSFCESINTTVSIYKTDEVKDIKLTATIYMDINAIGSNIAASDSVYWVVTRGDNTISCSDGLDTTSVINYGTFNGKSVGDSFALTSNVELTITRPVREYTVWIWIDNSVEEDELSLLTGETIDTNIWTQIDMYDNVDTATRPDLVGEAYAVYSIRDYSLRFYRSETPITKENLFYNGRVITAVYTGFEDDSYSYPSEVPWYEYRMDIKKVVFEDEIVPISTSYWFNCFSYYGDSFTLDIDATKLNTSYVTDMSGMFYTAGQGLLTIKGLENWDVSKVTNMRSMFYEAGRSATTFELDLSGWDTLSVIDMNSMFYEAGRSATTFSITGLENWDVSNVTNMYCMFSDAGRSATTWSVGDLSNWNVSSVTTMQAMFYNAGYSATTWSIGNISDWDVSNVTNMRAVFSNAGYSSTTFNIVGVENWDTLNVIDMYAMFENAGLSADYTLNLSSWNVDNVHYWKNFAYSVEEKITLPIWNTGDVIYAVYSADDTSLRFYDKSNIITKGATFNNLTVTELYALYKNEWLLYEMGPWENYAEAITNIVIVDKIKPTSTAYWFDGLKYCSSIDVTNLNISNVTDMSFMFAGAGQEATTFSITGLESWDTSNVTDMSYMFSRAGYNADYTLDLSGWNVCNVTDYVSFGDSSKITPPNFGMSCSS